jgi:hypothetical protein
MRHPPPVRLPLEVHWIMSDVWNYTRDIRCSKAVSEALAEETGNPLNTPTSVFYSHTPESSPIGTTIVARTDRRPRIGSGHANDIC